MTAFPFRMGAGSAGEVTRTHPASILPYKNDATAPVTGYGFPCFFNGAANDVRGIAPGDQNAAAQQIAGFVARPYPHQSGGAVTPLGTVGYGGGSPDVGSIVDVLQTGSILVPTNGTPNLGGPVYVWALASSAPHVQGGCEAAATAASTVLVAGAYFNGPPDSAGICEIVIRNP